LLSISFEFCQVWLRLVVLICGVARYFSNRRSRGNGRIGGLAGPVVAAGSRLSLGRPLREDFGMNANRVRYPSLALAAFLIVGSGHYAAAQPLGVNPSAAPSDIGNSSSINPSARASDIRNPSAINPAGAASQIPRSSAVSPTSPAQAMPRRAVQRTRRGGATATQVEQRPERAVPNRTSRSGKGTMQTPLNKRRS
jgi:hypothetical protein